MTGAEHTSKRPKIEFPCAYPIKVLGNKCDDFWDHVMLIMERHAHGFDYRSVTSRDSKNGNYQALTVTITATGEDQLKAIFADLKVSALVKLVL